jgi:hypothetical protein
VATRQTFVSDYSGNPITKDEVVSVSLTIKKGSEAGQKFDLDFTQEEYDEFLGKLESSKTDDPQPIRPTHILAPSKPGRAATGTAQVKPEQEEAWRLFEKHRNRLKLSTNKEMADVLEKWLAKNAVPKDRGTGNFTKVTPTKQGLASKVIHEYDNDQLNN